MATAPSQSLHDAVATEAGAVQALRQSLLRLRAAAEALDRQGMESALEEARSGADGLDRSGAERIRLATLLGRSLGLPRQATLHDVARAAADEQLLQAARRLRDRLGGLAHDAAVHGLCVRYGGQAFTRLVELRRNVEGSAPSYGPSGLLDRSRLRLGRTA